MTTISRLKKLLARALPAIFALAVVLAPMAYAAISGSILSSSHHATADDAGIADPSGATAGQTETPCDCPDGANCSLWTIAADSSRTGFNRLSRVPIASALKLGTRPVLPDGRPPRSIA